MTNTIKFLSHNQDWRLVVVDTDIVHSKQLASFQGNYQAKDFLQQVITNCLLFAAISDFNTKLSFKLKLTPSLQTYCLIQNKCLNFEYSDAFAFLESDPLTKLTARSTLSITEGDFSGLHTSTVSAQETSVSQLFTFFMKQSEQLPTDFLLSKHTSSLGLVLQPLPFADLTSLTKQKKLLQTQLNSLTQDSWNDLSAIFNDNWQFLWDKEVR